MTTSISKAVPRSRLNITYRTRIDGQVVRKELPLRLLVAGDFSGRASPLLAPGEHVRALPHLSQRIIYSIGKEGTLESILSRSRISLPIPAQYASRRQFALIGEATVRVECNRDADRERTFQLWLKSSKIDQAIELRVAYPDPSKAREVASDSALYSGELYSSKAFAITKADANGMPTWPDSLGDHPSAPVQSWLKKQRDTATALTNGETWMCSVGSDLHGWLEPPVSAAGEPPALFNVVGHDTKIWFLFDTDLDSSFEGDGRQSAEFRVRVAVTAVGGVSAIRLSDMTALSPERVASAVPQIRRLLVLRWLASQGRSMISANPVLRNEVKSLLKEQKAYPAAVAALLDTQRAIGRSLADPTTATNVTSADPDAVALKAAQTAPAPVDVAKIKALTKKVLSDEWALKAALDIWNLEVTKQKGEAAKFVVAGDTTASTDPDVVELRRLRALAAPSAADTAKIDALVAKIKADAWAENAAGPRPRLTPWQELHASVAGLKLENFKAQEGAQ